PFVIVPILTTSKSLPVNVFSVLRWSSFQRESGAPVKYQPLPLSATIIPYVFMAWRIVRASAGNVEILNDAFSRTRIPIGGRAGWDMGPCRSRPRSQTGRPPPPVCPARPQTECRRSGSTRSPDGDGSLAQCYSHTYPSWDRPPSYRPSGSRDYRPGRPASRAG